MSTDSEAAHDTAAPLGVGLRYPVECQSQSADDDVVDRDLPGVAAAVELGAQLQETVEFAVHREVEMRNGLLGFLQALGDDPAHVGDLDLLILHAGRRRRGRCGRAWRRSGGCRCSSLGATRGHDRLDVALDDAAVGPAAVDAGEVEAGLLRHAACQRARLDPTVVVVRLRRGGGLAAPVGPGSSLAGIGVVPGGLLLLLGYRLGGLAAALAGLGLDFLVRALQFGGVLVLAEQQGDHLVDRHVVGALGDEDLADLALIDRFDLHGRLVGLDLGQDVAGADLVALLDEPFRERALGHGRRELGHGDLDRHGRSPNADASVVGVADVPGGRYDLLGLRQGGVLQVGGIGQRCVDRGHAADRRIEQVEALLHDLGGDLGADAGKRPAFLGAHDPVGLLQRGQDRVDIERPDCAQVDHFGLDAVLGQLVGRLERLGDHDRECHDGDVGALALDLGLADRQHEIIVVRQLETVAVEQLVLQEDDRVGIADRRLQQALGVLGRPRCDHLEAGDMAVPARIALGVLGRDPRGGTVGAAEHDWAVDLATRHVERLGGRVDQVVHRLHGKIEGHELGDRA